MDVVDAPRPITRQIAKQGLRLADAFKGVAPGGIYQQIDSLERLFILSLPVQVITPSMRGEGNHRAQVDSSWRRLTLPALCSAMDAAKCAELAGLDSR